MVPHRAKAGLFGRSSILFRPLAPATNGKLVEPPGTAPGSEPIITGAFIAIVGVAPDRVNIGGGGWGCKGECPRWTSASTGMESKGWSRTLRDWQDPDMGRMSGRLPVPISGVGLLLVTVPCPCRAATGRAGRFARRETTPSDGMMRGGSVRAERRRWPFRSAFSEPWVRPFRRGGRSDCPTTRSTLGCRGCTGN